MNRKINNIKIWSKDNDKSNMIKRKLIEELEKYHFKLVEENYDLAISIGGDGTFLKMVSDTNFKENVYYVGINTGNLGFLQEINISECPDFVSKLNCNDLKEEKINLQETKIVTKREEYYFKSLNEIVIRDKDLKTFEGSVKIDNELLENFAGDGLLISTTIGSTAYNMSYGGSIIHRLIPALIITPIAPIKNSIYHSLTNPILIPKFTLISISPQNPNIILTIDGKTKEINDVIAIETTMSNKTIKCLKMNSFHFIKTVNQKLVGK